jgi:predicted dehydrogenase
MVKFGVVGLGLAGQKHCQAILSQPGATLVGVADVDLGKSIIAKQYGIPFYRSIEALLGIEGNDKPDVVCVCAPNHLHTVHAIAVLQAGCHVLIEKPMGISAAHCQQVIVCARESGKAAMVVTQNRFTPTSIWLKQAVSESLFGRILMVQVNCYWNRDERYYKPGGWKGKLKQDGGTLFTQFSHFIDILYWVFGDISDIHARVENLTHGNTIEFEDCGVASFKLVNSGGIGIINFSTSVWDKNLESTITIIGEKGTAKVGGQYMNAVEYCHIKDYTMPVLPPANPPNDYGAYKGSASNHGFIIQNVVDTLSGKAAPSSNALEGMKVVEMIERIYQSVRK